MPCRSCRWTGPPPSRCSRPSSTESIPRARRRSSSSSPLMRRTLPPPRRRSSPRWATGRSPCWPPPPAPQPPDAAPLETLLGELPKDGARVVLAAELTPAYEALIERYARRARRAVETPADEQATPLAAEYVASSPTARGASLRRLLDALDLPRAE